MADDTANENTTKWHKADPNYGYVTDYLEKALAHFRDCKIAPVYVAMGLTQAFIKLSPGKPYDKMPDEGALREGLSYLGPAAHQLEDRVQAYYRALDRAHHRRLERLAEQHGCTVEEAFKLWADSQPWAEDMPPGPPRELPLRNS